MTRRVLLIGLSKPRTRSTEQIADAFRRAGYEPVWIRWTRISRWLGKRLGGWVFLRMARRLRPDFAFMRGMSLPADLWTELGAITPTVHYSPDLNREPDGSELLPRYLELARASKAVFAVTKGEFPWYESLGIPRPHWVFNAADPALYYPEPGEHARFRADVSFTGRYRSDREPRHHVLKALAGTCDLAIYGRDWEKIGLKVRADEADPADVRKICAASKIVLGCDYVFDLELYHSNRLAITLASGGFLLTNRFPGMETLYEDGKHLVTYATPEEAVEKARYWLAPEREAERKRIAAAGCELVRSRFTYDHFVRHVIETLRREAVIS